MKKIPQARSLAIEHETQLPAFAVRHSEVVKYAPPAEPIRANLTLAQDIDFFLTNCALNYAASSVENYGRDLRKFEGLLSEQYGQPIPSDAVNVAAVQFFLLELRKRHVAPATFERNFYSLRAFRSCQSPSTVLHRRPNTQRPTSRRSSGLMANCLIPTNGRRLPTTASKTTG
jgi:hypothetical protein